VRTGAIFLVPLILVLVGGPAYLVLQQLGLRSHRWSGTSGDQSAGFAAEKSDIADPTATPPKLNFAQ
jgi:hypothetical protein